jgi:mono/diheme cytochrome c family protein
MQSRTVPTIVITMVVAAILFMVGALAFIYSGVYDIAATDPHLGLVRWVLNTTQVRAVEEHAEEAPEPPPVDPAMLQHGFRHYREMCVVCHGAPGVERGEFGQGMNPTPPDLAEMAERYSARELFWITKHGLKMAGMPAFGPTHSDEEIWGIVAFVQQLPEMSPQEYQRWIQRYGGGRGGHGHGGSEETSAEGESGHQH